VHPRVGKDGKIPPSEWVDETRLEVLEKGAVSLIVNEKEPAGPCALPPPHDGPVS